MLIAFNVNAASFEMLCVFVRMEIKDVIVRIIQYST